MRRMFSGFLAVFVFFSFFGTEVFAEKTKKRSSWEDRFYRFDPYFKEAAEIYGIPFALLKAIAMTENAPFKHKIKRKNKNGTYDYGLMQINSINVKRFGLTEKEILDPRINIFAAAKLLREIIYDKNGVPVNYKWSEIGKYHSKTPKYKKRWIKKVRENMIRLMKIDKRHRYIVVADSSEQEKDSSGI